MKQISSEKINRLLLDFSDLSNSEERAFIKGMNQFLFASAARKQLMRTEWMGAQYTEQGSSDVSMMTESGNIKEKHETVFGTSRHRG